MLLTRLRFVIAACWVALLAAVPAAGFLLGWPLSSAGVLALVILGCLPVVVLLVVFRGPPPQTVAEVLYEMHRTPSEVRIALDRLERRNRP